MAQLETFNNQKGPPLAGLSATKEGNSLKRGMPGWRRSADRTCLYENSLVSGNFTGNFAISGLLQPIPEQETAALQHFPEQFPKQINRENISRIREFLRDNRVFPRIVDIPMLVRCATW
jgi:hypothetical protein